MINKKDFFNRIPTYIGAEQYKQFAVLVPIIKVLGEKFVLFEKRSNNLRRQPGEICFPGGKLESNENFMECAIRETVEELNVGEGQIEILGPADTYISPFKFIVQPYIGQINHYKDTYSKEEVAEIIKIPLNFFMNDEPKHYQNELINKPSTDFPYEFIPGGSSYPWAKGSYDIYFYKYNNYVIWGMTASIMKSSVELIKEYQLFI